MLTTSVDTIDDEDEAMVVLAEQIKELVLLAGDATESACLLVIFYAFTVLREEKRERETTTSNRVRTYDFRCISSAAGVGDRDLFHLGPMPRHATLVPMRSPGPDTFSFPLKALRNSLTSTIAYSRGARIPRRSRRSTTSRTRTQRRRQTAASERTF